MRSLLVVLGVVVSSLVAVGAAGQAAGDAFVLRVDSEGSFFLADDSAPLDEASVVARAAVALSRDADVALVVEGDTAAPYESVKRAAVLLQEAGAKRISFHFSSEKACGLIDLNQCIFCAQRRLQCGNHKTK